MKQKVQPGRQKLEATKDHEFILGSLFVIANKLQTLLDREFKNSGLTVKQCFLSIIIGGVFEEPPTLSEAAAAMGSTHQNVKQLALKLAEKGFAEFIDDPQDGRALRLRLTQKSDEFWAGMQEQSRKFIDDLYKGFHTDDLTVLRGYLNGLMENMDEMDSKSKTRELSVRAGTQNGQ